MTAGRETAASPRRRRARRGEGERLRDQIIEAVERLLVETGDEQAVTIRAVADAVGVTPPSVYLHFADKDEMLFAVCERLFAELDRITQEAASGSSDPLESLALRGRAYVRFGVEHPEQYRILFMGKPSRTPASFDLERLGAVAAFGHLLEDVTRCVGSGLLRGDPLQASLVLWAGVHGLTSLLISKPEFPWPEVDAIADQLCRAMLHGLAPR
jgi:AcrR family transcriptional regulator